MELEYERLQLRVFSADHVCLGKAWKTSLFHPSYRVIPYTRIYFPLSGGGIVDHNGKDYQLVPGKMLLIPPYADVHVRCEEKLEKYWIHCNVMLPETRTDIFFLQGELLELDVTGKMEYYERIFETVLTYRYSGIENDTLHRFELNCALRMLLIPFFYEITRNPPSGARHEKLGLIQYISEHIHRKMTLKELAKAACLHPNYLCSSFHKEMHMSLFEYIGKSRLHYAMELLLWEKYSISEAAEKAGYCDAHLLYTHFKKYLGVSPREFLKKTRLENSSFDYPGKNAAEKK